ncbi:MarR family winged helix-turn-helix transcriptional regulator [Cellulomonas sp. P24]|uniref:MarR family winged helix-turn-helix transcriptional regulator n=1 Tax=Cellulomonas sp. P24 TaxID=2885206 RepID=UPI00216AF9BE|nr:MarR family transcriptional regulator [Cellulomonas sp. P24]MCR6491807.1 MarR family transcriptional regulator [Cellulomonas sp. P24]
MDVGGDAEDQEAAVVAIPERDRADARTASEAWESLFRAQVAVMRRLQADHIWEDLSMREYDVLFTLSRAPGGRLRLRDLNRSILLSQPSLSRLVDRLERAGLVERRASADDARGITVQLTDAGAARQRELGRRHVRTIHRYVAGALSASDLETLTRLTETLRLAQADLPDQEGDGPAGGVGTD